MPPKTPMITPAGRSATQSIAPPFLDANCAEHSAAVSVPVSGVVSSQLDCDVTQGVLNSYSMSGEHLRLTQVG